MAEIEAVELPRGIEKLPEEIRSELSKAFDQNLDLAWVAHGLARINGRVLGLPEVNYLLRHSDITFEDWEESVVGDAKRLREDYESWQRFQREAGPELTRQAF